MPDHRKTPISSALSLPLWVIAVSIALCIAAAGYLGYLAWDDQNNDSPSAASPTSQAPSSAAPTTPAPPTPTAPTPSATAPTTVPTPEPELRTASVGVFNQSGIAGQAASVAATIEQKGWNVSAIGNWRGAVPSTTIYYPEDLEGQAIQLGQDVGIVRILPRVSTMRDDVLTVVLVDGI
ncbi:hypothetical protein BH09ACT10_BH09ACT10_19980 [soil metagenome]